MHTFQSPPQLRGGKQATPPLRPSVEFWSWETVPTPEAWYWHTTGMAEDAPARYSEQGAAQYNEAAGARSDVLL